MRGGWRRREKESLLADAQAAWPLPLLTPDIPYSLFAATPKMSTVKIDTDASDLWPAMPRLVAAPPPPPFPFLRLPEKIILRVTDHLMGYDAFNPHPASRSLKGLAMANRRLRELLLPMCWKVNRDHTLL